MELTRQRHRFFWIGLLLVLAFLALGYRLVELQVIQHETFVERADRSHDLRIPLKSRRGEIRDRRGEVLARSLPARTIFADPGLIGPHYPSVARELAPILGLPEQELAESLRPRLRLDEAGQILLDRQGRPVTNRYVVLRRRVPEEEWRAMSEALATLTFGLAPGNTSDLAILRRSVNCAEKEDELREYPNGSLAGPVLGFTDGNGAGLEGLEAFLDELLSGVDGYIEGERSGRGGELRRMRQVEVPPQHGHSVYLTLDARLQAIVEEELAAGARRFQARGGCVVALQPRTGRILAMASYPGYDPNSPPLGPADAPRRRNWGVSHVFEPGSTFKLVAATAVLNERLLGLEDRVDCGERGRWQQEFGRERVVLTDVHAFKERYNPVERVVAESSNIGTFQFALRLGRPRYADYLFRFGFDQKSGIRLPLEEGGLLRPPAKWTMTDFSRIAMGYTVSVTPLQLTMAMGALANDGRLMRPQVIDRIVAQDGTVLSQPGAETVREVCRPEVAAKVRQALRLVVDDGTGSLVRMERYSIAGKTGTARVAPYRQDRYHASFVGFFPSENPEICITVLVEDPNPRLGYYGGKVAGPIFKAIAYRAAGYLGIRPDLHPEEEAEEDPEHRSTALSLARPSR